MMLHSLFRFAGGGGKKSWLVAALTMLVLTTVFSLVIHLHDTGAKQVVLHFQEDQLTHAQHIARCMEAYLDEQADLLRALSASPYFQHAADRTDAVRQRPLVPHIEPVYSFLDVSDLPSRFPGNMQEELSTWLGKSERTGKVLVSPVFAPGRVEGRVPSRGKLRDGAGAGSWPFRLFLLAPIRGEAAEGAAPKMEGGVIGEVSLPIDLERFIPDPLRLAAPKKGQRIWMIDQDGTLLFHSDRKDMAFRNAFQRDASCDRCHGSFGYIEEILKRGQEGPGTVAYQLRNAPKKLAAFAPLKFENISWNVVVHSPYDEVVASQRDSLNDYLILMVVLVFSVLGAAVVIYRDNRLRVQAEQESHHLRETQRLRAHTEEAVALERNKLKGILDSMADGVFIVTRDHEIDYVNPVIEREFGPAAGRKCFTYFHDRTEACPWCTNDDVLAGKSIQYERLFTKTGKIYDLFATPFVNADRMSCKLEIFHDITDKKKAENALRESEKQLRHLSSELLCAQEKERKRISAELHDDLGQSLAVLKLRVRAMERNLGHDKAELREEAEGTLQYLNQVIENVRRISRDLSPTIVTDLGLSAGLRRLVADFVKHNRVEVCLQAEGVDPGLSQHQQVMLYRIIQEALTNIEKHAGPSRACIVLERQEGFLSCRIEDDGNGFDLEQIRSRDPAERGLGLPTMQERVRMLGGTLDLASRIGEGTRIRFSFPIEGES
ncbi:MAG: ATP-binding protein [bacterium]